MDESEIRQELDRLRGLIDGQAAGMALLYEHIEFTDPKRAARLIERLAGLSAEPQRASEALGAEAVLQVWRRIHEHAEGQRASRKRGGEDHRKA